MAKKIPAVKMAKVDKEVVKRYIARERLNKNGTIEDRVEELHGCYIERARKDGTQLFECDVCSGFSPQDLSECPFCGTTGQEEIVEAGAGAKKDEAAADPPAADAPAREPIIPRVGTDVWSEKDLDRECDVIRKGSRMAAGTLFAMGRAFKRIHTHDLWKLRRRDDDKPAFTNFKRFVADEFGITHTYAYQLMEVSEKFTEEQIAELGVSKLRLALTVPDMHRGEILDAAKGGATVKDLGDKARELRGDGAPPPEKRITVGLMMGQQTVQAWKRPKKDGPVGVPTTPAKSLGDYPWAVLELENDVRLFVRMSRNEEGEIAYIFEARRGKET